MPTICILYRRYIRQPLQAYGKSVRTEQRETKTKPEAGQVGIVKVQFVGTEKREQEEKKND